MFEQLHVFSQIVTELLNFLLGAEGLEMTMDDLGHGAGLNFCQTRVHASGFEPVGIGEGVEVSSVHSLKFSSIFKGLQCDAVPLGRHCECCFVIANADLSLRTK